MLILKKDLLQQITSHCQKEFPYEACGIIAGRGSNAEKVYIMTNIDQSPSTYFMEAKEQLKVMKEIRNLDLEMVGIYHSHVASDAYPSARDVELAFYPEVSYLIVSLQHKEKPVIRSFKIQDGKIAEEELKIE